MNKICTSIEQSKKLIKLGIDVNTADMRYGYIAPYEFSDRKYDGGYDMIPYHKDFFDRCSNFSADEYDDELPCWSLSALIELMGECRMERTPLDQSGLFTHSFVDDYFNIRTYEEYDIVDAAVEMIYKLKEKDLL